MNEVQSPACPRCADGGNVRLIDDQEDSGIFKPLPAHPPRTLVFQCACGWATTVRYKPPAEESQLDQPGDSPSASLRLCCSASSC